MLDPMAAYRTSQVTSTNRAGQIVLLYQGAIRFGGQHLAFLEQGRIESAHKASIRCQEIVSALREVLDLSAGPIAVQLDQLYEFVLRRLVAGNVAKDPRPTEEAIQVMRGLLEAWQQIAELPASELQPVATVQQAAPTAQPAVPLGRMPVGAGSALGGALR